MSKQKINLFEIGDSVNYQGENNFEPINNTKILYYNDFFGYGIYHPKGKKVRFNAISSTKGLGELQSRMEVLFVKENTLKGCEKSDY